MNNDRHLMPLSLHPYQPFYYYDEQKTHDHINTWKLASDDQD